MAGSAYDFIITGRDQSGGAFESLARNAREAEGALAKMGNPLEELQKGAEKLDIVFKAFLGYEIVSRLGEFHRSVKEAAATIATQADAVGLTTDALQAYQAAFRSANLNVDAGQVALANFNVALGRAAQGDKETAEAFQRLGIRILDASGKVRENTTLLTETSRAMLTLEDTTGRAATAKVVFGKAGAQLTPVLREVSKGLEQLDGNARAASQTMNRETIETFKRLQDESDASGIKIRNLYATFAAPVEAGAKSWVARQFEEIAHSIALINTHRGVLSQIAEILNIVGLGGGAAISGRGAETRALDELTTMSTNLNKARDRLSTLKVTLGENTPGYKEEAEDVEKLRLEYAAASEVYEKFRRKVTPDRPPAFRSIDSEIAEWSGMAGNRFAAARPSGGDGRDRIGEGMRQLTANVDAAKKAYEDYGTAASKATSLDDLQREVELQKAIANEIARIGKFAKDDPRLPQIAALVTQEKTYDDLLKRKEAAQKLAFDTEKTYGDGTQQLLKTQFDLNEALKTNRLSQDAYTAANREAVLVQAEQAAKAGQYKEGLDGLVAGMQLAALQSQRQNSSFNQGVALYNEGKTAFSGFISEVNQGLRQGADVWTTFGNAGFNALNRIADKLQQMAIDQLFANAFGGAGGGAGGGGGGLFGFLGGLFGSNSNAGGFADLGSGAGITNGVPNFTGMASGGPIGAGEMHLVGEEGPELFMPRSSGTIVPNDALGGGGGISVTVQNTNYFGKVVSHAELEQQLAQVEQRAKAGAIAGVLDAKSRGGAYRSGMRR